MQAHSHPASAFRVATALLFAMLACAAITSSAGAPVQDKAPAVQPQAALPLVPLNVRVVDRAGRPVTTLQASDFTITDEDVPQPIRHFSVETVTAEAAEPGARPAARKGISLSPQPYRLFVIFLGRGRLEDASKAVTALAQFVRARLVPRDQVAVFAYDRALPFTTDHEKVAQLLDRFKRAHADINHEIELQLGPTGMAALYGRKAIPARLQTKIDELFDGPGARPPPSHATSSMRKASRSCRSTISCSRQPTRWRTRATSCA